MYIDKYWRDEHVFKDDPRFTSPEGYYTEDGLYAEDAESFIAIYLMGFCGCGDHEAMLTYIKNIMRELKDHKDSGFTKGYEYSGEKYLAWYVLDKLEWTEHGGSVPGWLTELGEDILRDLEELYV